MRCTRRTGSECKITWPFKYSNTRVGGKRAVSPPGHPIDGSFSSTGGGAVSVVATEEEILGAIQTCRSNGGESQADRNGMSGRSKRLSGVQEQVDQRPG